MSSTSRASKKMTSTMSSKSRVTRGSPKKPAATKSGATKKSKPGPSKKSTLDFKQSQDDDDSTSVDSTAETETEEDQDQIGAPSNRKRPRIQSESDSSMNLNEALSRESSVSKSNTTAAQKDLFSSDSEEESEDRSFKCIICDQTFRSNNAYEKHVKTPDHKQRMGKMKKSCRLCGRSGSNYKEIHPNFRSVLTDAKDPSSKVLCSHCHQHLSQAIEFKQIKKELAEMTNSYEKIKSLNAEKKCYKGKAQALINGFSVKIKQLDESVLCKEDLKLIRDHRKTNNEKPKSYSQLMEENKKLATKNKELANQIENQSAQIQQFKGELNESKEKLELKTADLGRLETIQQSYIKQNNKLKEAEKNQAKTESALKKRIEDLMREKKELNSLIEEEKRNRENLKNEMKKQETHRKALDTVKEKLGLKSHVDVEVVCKSIDDLKNQNEKLIFREEAFSQGKVKFMAQISQNMEEKNRLQKELHQCKESYTPDEMCKDLMAKLEKKEAKIQKLEEENMALEDEKLALQKNNVLQLKENQALITEKKNLIETNGNSSSASSAHQKINQKLSTEVENLNKEIKDKNGEVSKLETLLKEEQENAKKMMEDQKSLYQSDVMQLQTSKLSLEKQLEFAKQNWKNAETEREILETQMKKVQEEKDEHGKAILCMEKRLDELVKFIEDKHNALNLPVPEYQKPGEKLQVVGKLIALKSLLVPSLLDGMEQKLEELVQFTSSKYKKLELECPVVPNINEDSTFLTKIKEMKAHIIPLLQIQIQNQKNSVDSGIISELKVMQSIGRAFFESNGLQEPNFKPDGEFPDLIANLRLNMKTLHTLLKDQLDNSGLLKHSINALFEKTCELARNTLPTFEVDLDLSKEKRIETIDEIASNLSQELGKTKARLNNETRSNTAVMTKLRETHENEIKRKDNEIEELKEKLDKTSEGCQLCASNKNLQQDLEDQKKQVEQQKTELEITKKTVFSLLQNQKPTQKEVGVQTEIVEQPQQEITISIPDNTQSSPLPRMGEESINSQLASALRAPPLQSPSPLTRTRGTRGLRGVRGTPVRIISSAHQRPISPRASSPSHLLPQNNTMSHMQRPLGNAGNMALQQRAVVPGMVLHHRPNSAMTTQSVTHPVPHPRPHQPQVQGSAPLLAMANSNMQQIATQQQIFHQQQQQVYHQRQVVIPQQQQQQRPMAPVVPNPSVGGSMARMSAPVMVGTPSPPANSVMPNQGQSLRIRPEAAMRPAPHHRSEEARQFFLNRIPEDKRSIMLVHAQNWVEQVKDWVKKEKDSEVGVESFEDMVELFKEEYENSDNVPQEHIRNALNLTFWDLFGICPDYSRIMGARNNQ